MSLILAFLMQIYAPDATGTAVAVPMGEVFYREATDTFYQIFEFQGSPPHSWAHAQFTVKGYRHQGREGYLAKIPDATTHYYLVGNILHLRQLPAWIGLGVECENGVAVPTWDDDTPLSEQSFRAWAPNTGTAARNFCRGRTTSELAPVYYAPSDLGSRWTMGAPNTNIKFLLVEFPPLPDQPADD